MRRAKRRGPGVGHIRGGVPVAGEDRQQKVALNLFVRFDLCTTKTPTILAEKTISYAKAKTSYFTALREAVPELEDIAMGQEARPPEVDMFAQTFSVAGEKQEKAADKATEVLLKRFSRIPKIEKARVEFERAQKTEEKFHHDFDGVDFT